jgi:uncharacterized protein YjbJ (UPF0337 family)
MNQEQFTQFWGQLKNPLKKQWGKFTEDDLLQIEGSMDAFNRTIETRYGEMKEEVSKWATRRYALWTGLYEGYEESKPTG